jgi:hypothetical protein
VIEGKLAQVHILSHKDTRANGRFSYSEDAARIFEMCDMVEPKKETEMQRLTKTNKKSNHDRSRVVAGDS